MPYQKSLIMLVLSLSLFSFSNCGSTKENGKSITFQQNPPFLIEGVTSQQTVAGVKDAGTSTRLTVPVSQVKDGVTFKNLYYGSQMVEAQTHPTIRSQYLGFFTTSKKDFIMDSDPKAEAQNTPRTPLPFNLKKGEAVFSYQYEGKLHYYKISAIEELPAIYAPSQNSKGGINKL